MEQFWLKILVNLVPEMGNVDVNKIGRGIEVVIPDLFRDHSPGDDLARVSHEEFKKGVFLRREFDLCPFPKNPMSLRF
jgi:hypothetical protein